MRCSAWWTGATRRTGPDRRPAGYFSATIFIFARPASKSLPISLSMLPKTCISLATKGVGLEGVDILTDAFEEGLELAYR